MKLTEKQEQDLYYNKMRYAQIMDTLKLIEKCMIDDVDMFVMLKTDPNEFDILWRNLDLALSQVTRIKSNKEES